MRNIFDKIKENRPIQECLNTIATTDFNETIWFIYYMFFAIHNPKMEEYIQKKLTTTTNKEEQSRRDIIKNMIKRRHYTSKIVFQLYTHAYTNNGGVTRIYPKYKQDISKQLIKSYQTNHLKTTAVLLRRTINDHNHDRDNLSSFLEYVITTAPTIKSASSPSAVIHRINNNISYTRKDIIILALICHMKLDEEDINKKNIFFAATEEDNASDSTATPTTIATPTTAANEHEQSLFYDEKYKYLYT